MGRQGWRWEGERGKPICAGRCYTHKKCEALGTTQVEMPTGQLNMGVRNPEKKLKVTASDLGVMPPKTPPDGG